MEDQATENYNRNRTLENTDLVHANVVENPKICINGRSHQV